MQQIYLAFDNAPDGPPQGIAYAPKLIQGAPYELRLRLRDTSNGSYRNFSEFDEIRMKLALQQGTPPFLTALRSNGQIAVETGALVLRLSAAATATVKVPVTNVRAINELRFLHTVELLKGGVVVERLLHGHGYLVASLG